VPDDSFTALAGLRGEQIVSITAEACAQELAIRLLAHVSHRLAMHEQAHLALSGGSSGKLVCEAMAKTPDARKVDWARIHVWMVDERCVSDEDPRLNFSPIRDLLGHSLPVPKHNLHPMPVLQPDGAKQYESALRSALAQRPTGERCLDAVVLGMGADGHTASLFPNTPALQEQSLWVVVNDGETVAPPRPRMTMTYPILNAARFVALLVTGAGKRDALAKVAAKPEAYQTLPVAGILPHPGSQMSWFLDPSALPR
jgi:6-phosphogluconolactonase